MNPVVIHCNSQNKRKNEARREEEELGPGKSSNNAARHQDFLAP
jgi:hypothetical protein